MRREVLFVMPVAVVLAAVAAALAQTGSGVSSVTGNPKTDKLISQIRLEEKSGMIHGAPEPPDTQPSSTAGPR